MLWPGCLHDPHTLSLKCGEKRMGDVEIVCAGESGTGVTARLVGLGRGQVRSSAALGQNCK